MKARDWPCLSVKAGEAEDTRTRAKQLIHSLIRLGTSIREETRMNIRYHVGLTEEERWANSPR